MGEKTAGLPCQNTFLLYSNLRRITDCNIGKIVLRDNITNEVLILVAKVKRNFMVQ